ncbi:hypothetical protein ACFLRQ_01275 [Bacteroidota bacterium]
MKRNVFTLVMLALFTATSFGQGLSISASLGYEKPGGSAFTDSNGESMVGFGIHYGFDALFMINSKLGAGLSYESSALLAISSTEFEAGLYGLGVIGAKGFYSLTDGKIKPYGALTLGAGTLSTPEISVNGTVTSPAESAMSLGMKPELGICFGGFVINAAYVVPMGYTFDSATESVSAGGLQIGIGYRYFFMFK